MELRSTGVSGADEVVFVVVGLSCELAGTRVAAGVVDGGENGGVDVYEGEAAVVLVVVVVVLVVSEYC